MRGAGMIRIRGIKFIQYGDGFAAIGVIFVVGWIPGEQRERVERGDFGVIRIFLVHFPHRVGVAMGARVVVEFFIGVVEKQRGVDEIGFAFGARFDFQRLLEILV